MKTETKSFPLRVLLTVTTGRLLTESKDGGNGIGDLYDILGWMTNDSPFTHQLPRFAEECKPWLLTWFPELASVNDCLDALDGCIRALGAKEGVQQWLSKLALPAAYDVPRLRRVDHHAKDPSRNLSRCARAKRESSPSNPNPTRPMPKKLPKLTTEEQARVNDLALRAERERRALLYSKRLKTLEEIDRIYDAASRR